MLRPVHLDFLQFCEVTVIISGPRPNLAYDRGGQTMARGPHARVYYVACRHIHVRKIFEVLFQVYFFLNLRILDQFFMDPGSI